MSNGLCQSICTEGYAYAVIIGQSCYCSDDVPATQVSTDECHDPCPGYPADFCGNATAGYYAYFNLGRAASATIQVSTAAVSLSTIVNGSTTATSTFTVSSGGSSASSSTGTSDSIAAIQQYIQSAVSTQSGSDATNACFLGNTRYTSPPWYQNAPTQVQSYFSSTNQDISATCAALADSLFASPSHGLSKGAKAGIIAGAIVGALLLVCLILLLWLCIRRRRRRSSDRDSKVDERMDEKPIGAAAARMPAQFDTEHSSEHDYDDHDNHNIIHGAVIDHHQPLYYKEATVPPSTTAPTSTQRPPTPPFLGSPPNRTAMAAAALAWGREHPHEHDSSAAALASARNSPAQRGTGHVENSTSGSQASSVYETPYEALPQPQHMAPLTHNGKQGMKIEPPARTTAEQDFYIKHQEDAYQFPIVPGNGNGNGNSAVAAPREKSIPRKPVGILKNGHNHGTGGQQPIVVPGHAGQRESEHYTFYDDRGDEDYPYHAR